MTTTVGRSVDSPLRYRRFWGFLVLFAIGLVLDTQTTTAIIEHPAFRERNPFVIHAMATNGPSGILGVKLGSSAIVIGASRAFFDDAMYVLMVNLVLAGCGLAWLLAGLWNALLLA